METKKLLAALIIHNNGNWEKTFNDLKLKQWYNQDLTKEEEMLEGKKFITILDQNYPEKLRQQAYRQPLVLFYEGNAELLQNNDIIGIGMDGMGSYSFTVLNKLLFNFKHHYMISYNAVSLAIALNTKNLIVVADKGIDCLDECLVKTVLDNGGLVISEMPYGVNNNGGNDFTRIISALEEKLVIVHCKEHSFAIRQVVQSIDHGHDVFIMPTPLDSKEKTRNNELITEGGILFHSHEQLI